MKYRYAWGAHSEKVDILELAKESDAARQHFSCMSCGRDLIPVLGRRREKHFRHRPDEEAACSRETYLHALAKKQIIEGFSDAIQTRQPFILTLPAERFCTRWKDELGYTCQQPMGWREYDLTIHFDTVQIEAPIGGFVADILLTSSKSDEKLLIEIAVTHRCEQDKISSGYRIIEVSVSDENQAGLLSTGIDARARNVTTYNLKKQPPMGVPCVPNCGAELTAFFVYRSGKSRLLTASPEIVAAERQRRAAIYSRVVDEVSHGIIMPFLATEGYQSEALRALENGVAIKCCFFCRYAGLDTVNKPVFCKIRRVEVGVNEAVDCSAYSPES